jgi:TM2 domain-containing membrane protein YozV
MYLKAIGGGLLMEMFVLLSVGLYLALVGAIVVIYVALELLDRLGAKVYKKSLLRQENVKHAPWDGIG